MFLIHLEPAQLVQFILSTVLPLLVALVTKRDTHPGRRAILLALLTVATTFAGQLANALQLHTPFDLFAAVLTALASFVVSVGVHFGLWNPTGAAAALQGLGFGQNTASANVVALAPALAPSTATTNPDLQAPADKPAIPGTVLPDLAKPEPATFAPVETPYYAAAAAAGTDPAPAAS